MRLHGTIKMGYYPTPLTVIERIQQFISAPETQSVTALDPCCGEGLALRNLTEGLTCDTYGIELDGHRATKAKENLNYLLKGSYTEARITNSCFSLLYWIMRPTAGCGKPKEIAIPRHAPMGPIPAGETIGGPSLPSSMKGHGVISRPPWGIRTGRRERLFLLLSREKATKTISTGICPHGRPSISPKR